MTRVEFGRVKKGDTLFNQQQGLFRVLDIETYLNRTKKCVAQSATPSDNRVLVIDETTCSLWVVHR